MLELIKKENEFTMETTEGRQAINDYILKLNEENKNNIFYFAPTPEDVLAMQNIAEFINKKQGLKKAIFFAIEKARTHKNFKTNTTYTYIDNYMHKNNITSVYIVKAIHDLIYELVSKQEGTNEPPTIKINGELVESY